MKKVIIDCSKYIDDLKKGLIKANEIAELEGINTITVIKRLREYCEANGEDIPNFRSLAKRSKYNFDISKYIEKLEKNEITVSEISKIERVPEDIVRSRIKEYYNKHKKTKLKKSEGAKRVKFYIDKYVESYIKGEITETQIAKKEGKSLSAVSRALKRYMEMHKVDGIKKESNINEYFWWYYEGKTTLEELAIQEGVTKATIINRITRYCKENNIPVPDYRKLSILNSKKSFDISSYIEELRAGKITISKIAKEEGVSEPTVRKRLRLYCEALGIQNPLEEKNKNKRIDISKYIEQLKSGEISIRRIAQQEKVDPKIVRKAIKKYCEEEGITDLKLSKRIKKSINIEVYIEDLKARKITINDIAYEECVTYATVKKRLNEYISENEEEIDLSIIKKSINIEVYIPDYEAGKITQREIANIEGCCEGTVYRKLKQYYEEKGKRKPERKRIIVDFEKYRIDYEAGKITEEEIAELQGVKVLSVKNAIKRYYKEHGIERKVKSLDENIQEKNIDEPKNVMRTKLVFSIQDYIEEYENGELSPHQIAIKTKKNINLIKAHIKRYYEKRNQIPLRYGAPQELIIMYLKKGLTKEQIKESARRCNIIIPESAFDAAIRQIEQTKKE